MQAQVKRRIVFGLTTGGLLAGGGLGFAHADAGGATGASGSGTAGTSNSPGVLSGNSIQIPVDAPINVCGVTANVLGLLNPAAGNDCANSGGATASTSSAAHGTHSAPHSGSASTSTGGATAHGGASDSPGVLSGNNVQIPIHVPVNACGDTVNVVGLKNAALDNHCTNGGSATSGGAAGSGGATAHGGASDSPGVLSGNNVQVPVDVPVNACGDTVNVVGLKNVASGNHCANDSSGSTGATAHGGTSGSPGIISGNNVQLPIDVPVNACGDTVNVVGLLDSAKDDECRNGTPGTPPTTSPSTSPSSPPTSGSQSPPPPGQSSTPSAPGGSTTPGAPHGSTGPGGETAPAGSTGSLAHTGSDALLLAPIGAAMIGGGFVMYRKFKPSGSH
jgi:LPXTG-motif cell wall-anchored protein